jgi:nicotinamidase-related amidase
VFKHRYSPFDNTDLELLLRNLDVKTLVICGVNTNNCVLCSCFERSTATIASWWPRDVCASMNGPDYHEAALKLIEAALGWVIDSDEIVAALEPASAA